MLLIMFTVVATFTISLYITWERTLDDKYLEVKSLSHLLDQQLEVSIFQIIDDPSLSHDEKVKQLNSALQPSINNITTTYEHFGAGYYIKQLNTIIAFGPDFTPSGLIDISPDSDARTVYETGIDYEYHNYSQTRKGYVVANIHPIIRNGEIIGHSWSNVLLDDIFTQYKNDAKKYFSFLVIMLIIGFLGSNLITKQYKKNLHTFKELILNNKPLVKNAHFPKDLAEVYDAYTKERIALVESEQRFKDVVNSFDEFVWELDLHGNYTSLASGVKDFIGYKAEELLGLNAFDIFDDENRAKMKKVFEESFEKRIGFKDIEYQHQHKNGEYVYLSTSFTVLIDEQDRVIGYRGATRNITKQKENEASIRQLAYFDTLTKLPNRTSLNIDLETFIQEQNDFAVVFTDLDQFKSVNDTHGHQVGDQLITTIAQRLQNTLNNQDRIYRFGGDEFIIVLRNYKTIEQLKEQATKLLEAAKLPMNLNGQTFHTSLSIGISLFKEHAEHADVLIRYADLAMYKAKEAGKNQFVFFEHSLDKKAGEQFEISNLLIEAIAENQLTLFYQPQIAVNTGEICGLEALVRWEHPEKGFIPPAKFIPIAESNGLIVQLGHMILFAACKMRKQLLEDGIDTIRVAVNISLKQFQQDNFVEQVLNILQAVNLDGRYLELEITESIAMDSPEAVIEKLNALREYEIQVSIDDFGMGYSSLNYLKRLPIQQLKIDRAFVQDIDQPNDYAIVKSIISIAESLGLRVVAEGVETELQQTILKNLNCDTIQGYYYYKPMSVQEIFSLLQPK